MIKRYDNYLIPPIRQPLSYPDINHSLPKGHTFATAMRISAVQSLHYYYYTTFPFECKMGLCDTNDFTALLKLTRPIVRKRSLSYTRITFYRSAIFDDSDPQHYFRSSDEAYIDMFLNYPRATEVYPDIYHQLYSKYPEYFI